MLCGEGVLFRVSRVCIEGFRAIGSACLDFAGLTVLVGPNGGGKTSLLLPFSYVRSFSCIRPEEVRRGYRGAKVWMRFEVLNVVSDEVRDLLTRIVTILEGGDERLRSVAKVFSSERFGIVLDIDATSSTTTRIFGLSEIEYDEVSNDIVFKLRPGYTVYGKLNDALKELFANVLLYVGEDRNVAYVSDLGRWEGKRLYIYYPRPKVFERLVRWIGGIARYTDLRIVPELEERKLRVELFDGYAGAWIDIELAAGGVKEAIQILLALASLDEGIVVIDDAERGLHPAAQLKLAEAIVEAVKQGVQVILSTHSPTLLLALEKQVVEHGIENESRLVIVCRDQRDVRIFSTNLSIRGTLPEEAQRCLEEMGALGLFGEGAKLAIELANLQR